jgi:hypothetical protein
MTAGPQENARATTAQARGEAAEARHEAAAEAQHRISGSTVAVEPALSADDVAVSWPGSDGHGAAGVSPQPASAPNVARPLDNSQSQPG